jgi:AraC-like DNA-binding protein
LNESRIVMAGTRAARLAERLSSTPHAVHAVTLHVGLDADVTLTIADRRLRGRVLALAPDIPYAAQSPGPGVCFLFDPQRTGASLLIERPFGRVEGKLAERILTIAAAAGPNRLDVMLEEVAGLVPSASGRIDARVEHALELWRPDSREVLTVTEVARRVRLSRPHFAELFTRAVGMTPRRYRLWTLAMRGVSTRHGGNATERAHDAGFADLAHFTRVCRRFFGYTPSELFGTGRNERRIARRR